MNKDSSTCQAASYPLAPRKAVEFAPSRHQHIRAILGALSRRHEQPYPEALCADSIEQLLRADREANSRWSMRVDRLMRFFGWLSRIVPLHDLELLGQMDFNSLSWLYYYHLKHFALSPQRPALEPRFGGVLAQLEKIRAQIPIQTEPYRQQPCTPETALQRAALCLEQLGLPGPRPGRLLFLGDDDLTSVAVALLAKDTRRDVHLTVVDVDHRLLQAIEDTIAPLQIPIDARNIDLFSKKNGLGGRFELVFADPSYEELWVRQFAAVAIDALVGGGHFLLSLPHPNGRDWLPRWIEQLQASQLLSLRSFHEAFSEYAMLPNRSSWLGLFFTWFLPVSRALARQYQSLPFSYSDLMVFEKAPHAACPKSPLHWLADEASSQLRRSWP